MAKIFISYKRADKKKVFNIKDQIESALREKCWIDLDGIESDAQFVNVIVKAIDEAEVVLFMYSSEHKRIKDYEHDWTVKELNYAQEEQKRIVIVNIDNCPLSGWFKFMFGQKQQVDGTSDDNIQRLILDMKKWIKDETHERTNNLDENLSLINRPGPSNSNTKKHSRKHFRVKILFTILSAAILISVTGFYFIGKSTLFCGDEPSFRIETFIPCIYDYAEYCFDEGLASVKKDGECFFIDTTGSEVINFGSAYERITNFQNGLAIARDDYQTYFVNKSGEQIHNNDISNIPSTSSTFNCGMIYADRKREDGKREYGFIDTTGKLVIPYEYEDVGYFVDGVTWVKKDGRYGVINKNGTLVIPCDYDCLSYYYEGFAFASKNGQSLLLDKVGNETLLPQYDKFTRFSEGLACVNRDNKIGFINKAGKEVIPCMYQSASMFTEGLAAVMKEGKIGFIDNNGRVCIPFQYEYDDAYLFCGVSECFRNGFAHVKKDSKWGFIDKQGNTVVPFIYDRIIWGFSEGYVPVCKAGGWGYADTSGNEVVPCIYEEAWPFSNGLAKVKQGGKWGYLKIIKTQ